MIEVPFKKLNESAVVPTYSNHDDAGADLYAIEDIMLHGGQQKIAYTGLAVEIPEGYMGLIRPRSGLATRHGIGINTSGVVDAGYRGELMVTLINHSNVSYTIAKGERMAQIIFVPIKQALFREVDDLKISNRGHGGHGSTGK